MFTVDKLDVTEESEEPEVTEEPEEPEEKTTIFLCCHILVCRSFLCTLWGGFY